ncbi:chorismate mutase [Candidatus Peregrinibacteria bacterium]|nr:chorismate mutase [Candidatus Peregrinibacteria bacterium]
MIEALRKEIDKLDIELVKLLFKRMELAAQLGREKRAAGEKIHQKTREMAVLDNVKLQANSLGLSEGLVTDIYTLIFAESRRLQNAA